MFTSALLASLGMLADGSMASLDEPATDVDLAAALARWREAHAAWLLSIDTWRAALVVEGTLFDEAIASVPKLRSDEARSDGGRAHARGVVRVEEAAVYMETAARALDRAAKVIRRVVARLPALEEPCEKG